MEWTASQITFNCYNSFLSCLIDWTNSQQTGITLSCSAVWCAVHSFLLVYFFTKVISPLVLDKIFINLQSETVKYRASRFKRLCRSEGIDGNPLGLSLQATTFTHTNHLKYWKSTILIHVDIKAETALIFTTLSY